MKPNYYRAKTFDAWWLPRYYDLHVWLSVLGRTAQLRQLPVEPLPCRTKTILDFATGTGAVARQARQRFPDAVITGIDLSAGMLAVAQRKSQGIIFLQRDIAATTLPSGSADAVTLSFALHDVPQDIRPAVLKEVFRVLGRGGTFVLLDYHWPRSLLFRLLLCIQFFLFENRPAWSIFREDLPAALRRAGFRSVRKTFHYHGAAQRLVAVK